MSRKRFWGTFGTCSALLVGGVITWYALRIPDVSADYTAGNFSTSDNGTTYALDSQGNVFMGSFVLPNPATDTLLIDGAGNTVAGKNVLSAFSGSNQMFDTDNGGDLDATDAIFSSANTSIDASDVVLTTGTNALTSFPTTEGPGNYYLYFDQGATSSSFDNGEDIYRQVFQNLACTATDGTTNLRIPEATWAFLDMDADNTIDFESSGDSYGANGETFIRDADADGFPSAGDSVIVTQSSGIRFFQASDNVCFDGSVVNDSEYDPSESLWIDVAGDCAAFSSGVDSILIGGVPSGTSTLASAENELGYLDANGSTTYSCTRAGSCEAPVYSGANATAVFTTYIASTASFFDSATDATNGIRTTGAAWDETGGIENLVDISTLLSSGEARYLYADCDTSSTFTSSEDIFMQVVSGATAVMTNGVTARTFDASERALITPGNALSSFNATNGAILLSADANLSAGALNGGGTDRVILPSGTGLLDPIPAVNKYFDHDASGSFVGTDDVVVDADTSGYYNADDIVSVKVAAAASSDVIDDTYLNAVRIYERTGNTCVGAGIDTLLGADTSSPFLNQAITLTKAPYASGDAAASRTMCVFADIANNSVHGKIWTLVIPATGAVFASSVNSPTTDFTAVSSPVQFVTPINIAMTAASTKVGVTTTYTFSYTVVDDAVPNNHGIFRATFPSTFNVSGATTACTANGSALSVTPSVSDQTVRANNASGGSVSAGTVVVCTVSNVRNPVTAGTTTAFEIGTYASSTSRMLSVDLDNTVTTRGGSSSSGAGTVSNTITLTAPNGGESLAGGDATDISWTSTGTGISYVNLYYSIDDGTSWTTMVTNEANDGAYTWTIPNITSSTVSLKIEGTDLAEIADDDVSDAEFTIASSSSTTETSTEETEEDPGVVVEVPEEEVPVSSTLTGGEFIKLAEFSTVYGIDDDLNRHPIMDAQTYFTYHDNFDVVLTVDEDTFNQSHLGSPMLVNPGTILVQFDSSPTVYTVNIDAEGYVYLRPIPDEATVAAVITDDWAEHVIRLSDAVYPYYRHAEDAETVESLTEWVGNSTLTDAWHLRYPDPTYDPDGDGAATWMEASWATDPYRADTDGDGYDDKTEHDAGYSPLSNDTDGDGYTDVEELRSGHNPFLSWVTEQME